MTRLLLTQAQAMAAAKAERRKGFLYYVPMAIVLTTDEGVPTHEYCPTYAVETLYGPLIKAELARVVAIV